MALATRKKPAIDIQMIKKEISIEKIINPQRKTAKDDGKDKNYKTSRKQKGDISKLSPVDNYFKYKFIDSFNQKA